VRRLQSQVAIVMRGADPPRAEDVRQLVARDVDEPAEVGDATPDRRGVTRR